MMSTERQIESVNLLLLQTVWPFVLIIVILLGVVEVSLELKSSVRAYVEAESLWSKGQKSAYIDLSNYLTSHLQQDYDDYLKDIAIPMGYHEARLALEQEKPNLEMAYKGFIAGKSVPDDIPGMIRLYRYFGHTQLMAVPISIWSKADDELLNFASQAGSIHHQIEMGKLDNALKAEFIQRLNADNIALTPLEEGFSSSLSVASHRLDYLINGTLAGMTVLLVGLGLFLSRRLALQRVHSSNALVKESEKNIAFLRNASDGIHILDHAGNIVEVSDSFCEMLGYTRDEMIGMNVLQWDAHFVDLEQVMSVLRKQFETRERSQFETKHRRKDGVIFDVEVSGKSLDLGGRVVLFNSSRDITDRKIFEDELAKERDLFKNQNAFLNTILESEPECVKILAPDGNLVQMNRAGLAMLEVETEAEARQYGLINFLEPQYRKAFADLMTKTLRGENGLLEFKVKGKRGTVRWLETHSAPLRDNAGQVSALLGLTRDITEKKKIEHSLRESLDFTQSVIHAIPDLMFELDLQGAYINVWAYEQDLLAEQKELLLGKRVSDVLPEEAAKTVMSALQEASVHGKSNGQIIRLDLPVGTRWFELSTAVMNSNQARAPHFIVLSRDSTDRQLAKEQIQHLAYYDHLTGLPNRRLFRDRLERDMMRVKRNNSSLALLFIDLDKFKEVNDTLGHHKGDMLLIEAANRIRQSIGGADTFARLGGDEFAIILPEFGEMSNIDRVVKHVLQALEMPFELGGGNVGHISGSIGIALYPDEVESIDDLLRYADQAMYAAKSSRENRFRYFTRSMQEEARNKLDLTNDLRLALELKQLEVYFQPIVDASSREIVKAEALLRWHHPRRGEISPIVFIPLAEESGLILEIGDWVFMEVFRNIKTWQQNTGKLLQVSVNKSAAQFAREDTPRWRESYLRSGLPEKIITVEITESLLLSDSDRVRSSFEFFREHGIELSIDDFGTGFSALSYLNRFDVDYLKIDKSFVQKMTTDASSKALTEAIIIMAHKLNIRTIAEGVETEEQRDLLISFGCDYLQGFLFSRPVPEHEFERLLGVSRRS